ncbi:slightly ste11-like protein [Vermiconidia calcicola]|uniref:Slightly ste11-like protein n=1 Tax=Vermiconidia calcicola TaxID=1690605 RepID=A0ACC3MHA7_9PEZI|nr:slightly ste11-like protein [Vermiconidia calcicola]
MPDESQTGQDVLNKSQVADTQASHNAASSSSRRTSSTISLRPRNLSPSPSRGSKTPLTPEESPPFRTTRKRSAGIVEQEDKALDSADISPAHTRASSGDSAVHVCICQSDPKIPRPRNAFILYRQHHQANVVAQNPGLANPEISKIIGEQWQGLPTDEKNKWKALAEEEKLRHQQQYPTYRYQPKRNGRRNSLSSDPPGSAGEKPKCHKCGGRTILTPSAPFSSASSLSVPPTPGAAITPVSRTLPVLRDLSLQSPAAHRMSRPYSNNMSPHHNHHMDERDDVGPLSPDTKRRRYNGDHATVINRAMPPRYGVAHSGAAVGPGTPFPFGQVPPQSHPYPPAAVQGRRESLPGLRGVVSPPGPMAPPPRPGMGYQQHRLSQGHVPHDRSLTLPPLQTGHPGVAVASAGHGKTAEEQIMNIAFRYKIKVLSQVAPPAVRKQDEPRGPLIAVEGDSRAAAKELALWLRNMLGKDEELSLNMIEGPGTSPSGTKEQVMAQYHRLAAEWLSKGTSILESLAMVAKDKLHSDATMTDATPVTSPKTSRKLDEDYNDIDDGSAEDKHEQENKDTSNDDTKSNPDVAMETGDVEKEQKRPFTTSTINTANTSAAKPVSIVANYSLHTSNVFACLIPIGPHDPYSPNDHWQWTATQWRGIIGPDLTIYVRDAVAGESGRPSVEIESVDGRPDVALIVVTKSERAEGQEMASEPQDGGMQVEASVLRRVGFEVSEWVKAFGSRSGKE